MIEIRMLGEIRLRADDGTEVDSVLRQPKRLALLAYLASPSPGTWHRREMLLALFWPELDSAHARTSLRNGLYVLRQALGESTIRNRGDDEISIDPQLVTTDLATVWAALKSSEPESALNHYQGELLPGLYPPDCDGFQRWLDSERTRLKVAVTTSAMSHIETLERDGKRPEALVIARRVMDIQTHDETVVRRVMELHESMGDRAGALSVFESYRSLLASDFDADPAPETIAVSNRLRAEAPLEAKTRRDTLHMPSAKSVGVGESQIASAPAARLEENIGRRRSRLVPMTALGITAILIALGLAWRDAHQRLPLGIGKAQPLTVEDGIQVQAAISPNGRLVAYAKGNSNHLRIFVQKIDGAAAWPLTGDTASFEIMPRWSPDNDRILYLARNNVYVSPTMGGASSLVARGSGGDGMVRSASWSPAGDSIAIVRNDSLLVQPVEGSGSRLVGRGFQLHSCTWSPSGTLIACVSGNLVSHQAGPLFGNEAPSAVVIFPAAGGKPTDITGTRFQHQNPTWSADGAFLWIISNRDGSAGEVYAIPIGRDGHADGAFTRVGLRAESIDMSAGRIAYSVPARKANAWAVPLPDGEKQLTLASARQITFGNQLVETVAASPDGKWLTYDSNVRGQADIYRVPIDGGIPERLTTDQSPEYAGEISPDGSELAWQRFVSGRRHLFVKKMDGDAAIEIMPEKGDQGVPRWSPDGDRIAGWSHETEQGAIFVLERGENGNWKTPSWRLEDAQLPMWSPDGRTLAFVKLNGSIETIPADSGLRTRVYTPRVGGFDPVASNLVWSRDGRTIWFIGADSRGRGGIWSVPAAAGLPRLRVNFDDGTGRSHGPSISADRTSFYFTLDERTSNMRWAELVKR